MHTWVIPSQISSFHLNPTISNFHKIWFTGRVKGGESSSQSRWFTIAKIEL